MLEEYRARLREAREQAEDITVRARKAADALAEEAKASASQQREELMADTRRDIEAETRRALDEIRKEVANLTVIATEKVTRKSLTPDDHRRLIRRRWSSGVSDLRVTFSVAITVRLATSLRISSSARRVSASMSRRVAAISSSRCLFRGRLRLVGERVGGLARADGDVLGLSRASRSRARYSSSSSSASRLRLLGVLDRLLDRAAALVERLRDAREGELVQQEERRAEREQRQIISPTSG